MNQTDFLFARPSFIGGMASVLDLGVTLVTYNESKTTEEADTLAIKTDWKITGDDIRSAMNSVINE